MATRHSTDGRCPECGFSIPDHLVLIEYDTEDGTKQFAECERCEAVVHPVTDA